MCSIFAHNLYYLCIRYAASRQNSSSKLGYSALDLHYLCNWNFAKNCLKTYDALIHYIRKNCKFAIQASNSENDQKTGSNITYTWDPVTAVNNATINYSVSYKVDESNIDLGNIGTSTNYTFDIIKINKGKSFTITVTTIATASGGGITTASKTSDPTIRAGEFTIESGDSFWIKNCDNKSGQETGKYIYSYLTNKLEWAAATQANESGTNFTYTLYQRVNSGNWN